MTNSTNIDSSKPTEGPAEAAQEIAMLKIKVDALISTVNLLKNAVDDLLANRWYPPQQYQPYYQPILPGWPQPIVWGGTGSQINSAGGQILMNGNNEPVRD